MSERDDDAANEHAAVLPEEAVRDETAENRGEPHGARVPLVYAGTVPDVEPQPSGGSRGCGVQDEKPPHPVVAEPLPHLREEERGQPPRMPEPACLGWDGRGAGRGHQSNSSF